MDLNILQQILGELKTMNGRFDKLEQGQAEINQQIKSLTSDVSVIRYHQNEGYDLLKAVDKKINDLATISNTHE